MKRSIQRLNFSVKNHQNILSIPKVKFQLQKVGECKKSNFSRKLIKKMEPPKMTSKRVQGLLIKRYEHFKFFSRFQPRKKTKFQPENQYHKIFLTLKILVNSNLSRKNVVCKKLNFNREQIKKMEPNQPTTMLMSEQVKRLKDIGQQRQQTFQSKQSKANQYKHSKVGGQAS